jgi:serine/threonine-protein kinase
MAPEQLAAEKVTRAADVYAAGVLLWELVTGERLFAGDRPEHVIEKIMLGVIDPPSAKRAGVPCELDEVVLRAMQPEPSRRFESARDMAIALEMAVPPAGRVEIGDWVREVAHDALSERAVRVAAIERAAPVVSRPSSRSRTRRAVMLGAGLGLGSLLAIAAVRRVSDGHRLESVQLATKPAESAGNELRPEPSTEWAALGDTPRTAVSGTTEPSHKPSPLGEPPRAVSAAHRPPIGSGSAAATNGCAVPFRLDADGRRVYKRQCL